MRYAHTGLLIVGADREAQYADCGWVAPVRVLFDELPQLQLPSVRLHLSVLMCCLAVAGQC